MGASIEVRVEGPEGRGIEMGEPATAGGSQVRQQGTLPPGPRQVLEFSLGDL